MVVAERLDGRGAAGEEVVDVGAELVVLDQVVLGALLVLLGLPVGAHVGDLRLVVERRVVVLADAAQALPHGQMLGVHGHAVVLGLAALAEVGEAALLLLEVEAGGVGQPEEGHQHAGQAEPGHDVEAHLDVDVVEQDGREERADLADGGGEAVRGGADGRGVDLGRHEEGDGVGAELVEERGEEVHGLEGFDASDARVVLVVERGHDEEDEIEQEPDLHHHLAAVQLVVDQESLEGQHCKEGSVQGTYKPCNIHRGILPRSPDSKASRS